MLRVEGDIGPQADIPPLDHHQLPSLVEPHGLLVQHAPALHCLHLQLLLLEQGPVRRGVGLRIHAPKGKRFREVLLDGCDFSEGVEVVEGEEGRFRAVVKPDEGAVALPFHDSVEL